MKFHVVGQNLYFLASELGLVEKSIDVYRAELRSLARGLWSGAFDAVDFLVGMNNAVERGLTRAFSEGLAEFGISLDETTAEERGRLETIIAQNKQRIFILLEFVERHSKANGGLLRTVFIRIDLWAQAYTRAKALARVLAGEDEKLKWNLHPAEHCPSCLKLDGKVKRASFWAKAGVYPKAWGKLQCNQGCKCTQDPTTDPVTPGPLPALP